MKMDKNGSGTFHWKVLWGNQNGSSMAFLWKPFGRSTLLEEKVIYRTLKGSISATYLEPLKGSIHS